MNLPLSDKEDGKKTPSKCNAPTLSVTRYLFRLSKRINITCTAHKPPISEPIAKMRFVQWESVGLSFISTIRYTLIVHVSYGIKKKQRETPSETLFRQSSRTTKG